MRGRSASHCNYDHNNGLGNVRNTNEFNPYSHRQRPFVCVYLVKGTQEPYAHTAPIHQGSFHGHMIGLQEEARQVSAWHAPKTARPGADLRALEQRFGFEIAVNKEKYNWNKKHGIVRRDA